MRLIGITRRHGLSAPKTWHQHQPPAAMDIPRSGSYAVPLDQSSMPSTPRPAPDRGALIVGMLVLYVVWGSTYLGIAIAVQTIPPFLMAAARFLLAGVILLGWSFARDG